MEVDVTEFDEMPTLECKPENCNSCSARFKVVCRAACDEWDGDTEPTGPKFLEGYDDDYILDEVGGESG